MLVSLARTYRKKRLWVLPTSALLQVRTDALFLVMVVAAIGNDGMQVAFGPQVVLASAILWTWLAVINIGPD